MNLVKKIAQAFIQPIIRKRIHRASIYKWRDITLYIPPGVFHPAYFFSTKILLKHILERELKEKSFLELGAGNGLISIAAAKQQAIVSASDISIRVVETLKENARSNNVDIKVIHSDLFDNIPAQQFDIIAINPPYYPKNPKNEFEQAWYCGEHFEYFEKFFFQLTPFLTGQSKVFMVLSEECDIETIRTIAIKNKFTLLKAVKKRIYWEMNYIFEINKV